MSYGPITVHTASMASAGTLTGEVNLGRSWKKVFLAVPTMASGSQLHIQVSDQSGGTFRRLSMDKEVIFTSVITMASGGTLTASLDLGEKVKNPYIQTPSFATNTQIFIHGSRDNSTFARIAQSPVNSSTVALNDYVIASGASARLVPLPEGIQYLKVELGSGVTQVAHSFTVIGTRVGLADFHVPSFVTNRMVPLPVNAQFVKVESTATVDNGVQFKIICSD